MQAVQLTPHLKLRLTGGDRLRWLNGQVSQDVRKVTPAEAAWACVCNHRGKMDGILVVSASADGLWVTAEPELAETLPPRLERYIIADDVILEDVSADYTLLHMLASATPAELPEGVRASSVTRFGQPGTDLWLPTGADFQEFVSHFDLLAETSPQVEFLRIASGRPAWGKELSSDILPPEARLEALTVDYHKGCYTGQEVISRMKTAGRTNRLLTSFTGPGGPLLADLAADLPVALHNDSQQPVGQLTSVAISGTGELVVALGYLQKAGYGLPQVFTEAGQAWQVG